VVLEQLEKYAPKALDSFKRLVDTGRVELLGETYYHSLAFFYSQKEFERQVKKHSKKINDLFGKKPEIFRNTELAYNNKLGKWAEKMGYKGILAEGWDTALGWKSPNFIYKPKGSKKIKLLLKNYRLSDDIAFRFSERTWKDWPLTAEKFSRWVSRYNGSGETINLFLDYETFGEHQWEETGIFNFLRSLPGELMKHPDNKFNTLSEVLDLYPVRGEIDVPGVLTWADTERDLSAWVGNEMQIQAVKSIYELEKEVRKAKDSRILEDWRRLQISDHFYYMCTKWFSDGDIHAYFSPFESPYEAFIAYMNILNDLKLRLKNKKKRSRKYISS
jgi:alpha-amylase